MSVGETIMRQLGGTRFGWMVGTRDVVLTENGVRFKFMKTRSKSEDKQINGAHIRLNGRDLYDVSFRYVTVNGVVDVSSKFDVGAENLVRVFEGETGLYTTL